MIRCRHLPWFATVLMTAASASFAYAGNGPVVPVPSSLTVQPTTLDLRHHRQPHALQVLGTSADGYSLDLRSQACLIGNIRRSTASTPVRAGFP